MSDRIVSKPSSTPANPWSLLRSLVEQIEMSNAVDDHGHRLSMLQALRDARAALDAKEKGR